MGNTGIGMMTPFGGAAGTALDVGNAFGAGLPNLPGAGMLGNALYHQNNPWYTDPGARPEYAKYSGIRDPNTGLIQSPGLNEQYGPSIANQLNTQGLQAFRERALAAPGTSAWEQMAKDKQALEEQRQAQNALESGASRAAEARSTLARGTGLSSGAQERMARGSMRDILSQQQGVGAQGALARAGIGQQAEEQRLAALSQLPGMETQALNPQFQERGMQLGTQQFNIQNALQQKQAEEAAKLAEYQEKMRGYAATQQANAIGASGPKAGGLLGGIFG